MPDVPDRDPVPATEVATAARAAVIDEHLTKAEGEAEDRTKEWARLALRHSEKLHNSRFAPAAVMAIGFVLAIVFPVLRMLPDSDLLLTADEAGTAMWVGGLMLLGGATLSLLSTVLPLRALNGATLAWDQRRQQLLRQREDAMNRADDEHGDAP